jgi:23S rRNA pseudouridine2604 synthase
MARLLLALLLVRTFASAFRSTSIVAHTRGCGFWSFTTNLGTASSFEPLEEGIRLNKVFKKTHSRREADKLIEAGRVSVNDIPVKSKGGFKVVPFRDKITLDGIPVTGWEGMNAIVSTGLPGTSDATINFDYVKYWKPVGVTCTTDRKIAGNIIDALEEAGFDSSKRIFPVGRLDKETSGLILLTSDGRVPNAVLRGRHKQPKIYQVWVDRPVLAKDVAQLRDGVIITTVAQRDGNRAEPLTARTKSCAVQVLGREKLQLTLVEGRNRQIRKMLGALNYTVRRLHRVQFMELTLDPLQQPGEFCALEQNEVTMLHNIIREAEQS